MISTTLTLRQRASLADQLDALSTVHGQPALLGVAATRGPIPRVIANLEADGDRWIVNPAQLLTAATQTFQSATAFDLELHVPDSTGRVFLAALDEAPQGTTHIDPDSPPGWLTPL